MDMFSDVPRGNPSLDPRSYEAPQAQWLARSELPRINDRGVRGRARIGYDPLRGNGIFLGQWDDQFIGVTDDDRHIITCAGARSGKGTSAIIPNLLSYQGSMLVIDPKGENAAITARHRAFELRQRVYVLDPFHVTPAYLEPYRVSYNPMTLLRPDSPTLVSDAGLIADALFITTGRETEPHWNEAAKAWVQTLILHVATYADFQGHRNLVTVRHLLGLCEALDPHNPIEGEFLLKRRMESNTFVDGVIQSGAREYYEKQPRERHSVLSVARRQTNFLDITNLRNVLTEHEFDLIEMRDEPMTLYLCVPAIRLSLCSRWMRLFVSLLMEAMTRELKPPPLPVIAVLDEFPVLGHMQALEDAVGQIAGYGLRLWPIIQDLTQLKALYRERWETFMANAGVLQFFGMNDMTTLQWVSSRCGDTVIVTDTRRETTAKERETGRTGENLGRERHPLITPEEAARIFARGDRLKRQLIIQPDARPLIIQRSEYFDTIPFKKWWGKEGTK